MPLHWNLLQPYPNSQEARKLFFFPLVTLVDHSLQQITETTHQTTAFTPQILDARILRLQHRRSLRCAAFVGNAGWVTCRWDEAGTLLPKCKLKILGSWKTRLKVCTGSIDKNEKSEKALHISMYLDMYIWHSQIRVSGFVKYTVICFFFLRTYVSGTFDLICRLIALKENPPRNQIQSPKICWAERSKWRTPSVR